MNEWIKDPRTGLKWGPISEKSMSWRKTQIQCEEQKGRCPSKEELIDLFENGPEEIKKYIE